MIITQHKNDVFVVSVFHSLWWFWRGPVVTLYGSFTHWCQCGSLWILPTHARTPAPSHLITITMFIQWNCVLCPDLLLLLAEQIMCAHRQFRRNVSKARKNASSVIWTRSIHRIHTQTMCDSKNDQTSSIPEERILSREEKNPNEKKEVYVSCCTGATSCQ